MQFLLLGLLMSKMHFNYLILLFYFFFLKSNIHWSDTYTLETKCLSRNEEKENKETSDGQKTPNQIFDDDGRSEH